MKAYPPEVREDVYVVPKMNFGAEAGQLVNVASGRGWKVERLLSWSDRTTFSEAEGATGAGAAPSAWSSAACRWKLFWEDGRLSETEIVVKSPLHDIKLLEGSAESGTPEEKKQLCLLAGGTAVAISYNRTHRSSGYTEINIDPSPVGTEDEPTWAHGAARHQASDTATAAVKIRIPTGQVGVVLLADVLRFADWAAASV
jgi:hypothetical protein